MNDRLSPNSLTLVEKVDGDEIVFFCVRVRTLLKRLPNVFGHLRILSDPYEKCQHSQDENVTPID